MTRRGLFKWLKSLTNDTANSAPFVIITALLVGGAGWWAEPAGDTSRIFQCRGQRSQEQTGLNQNHLTALSWPTDTFLQLDPDGSDHLCLHTCTLQPPPPPIVKQSSDMATKFLPPIFMLQGQTVSGFSVALKGTCCCPLLL